MTIKFEDLLLNESNVDHNFFAYEKDVTKINNFEHNDLINDWLIEHIRRFNSSVNFLINDLRELRFYTNLLTENKNKTTINNVLVNIDYKMRCSCRNICIDLDIYIEKIKEFCRYYFFMDKEKTDAFTNWEKALKQFVNIRNGNYILNFLKECKHLFENDNTQYILGIRNAEIHNYSPLDLIEYKFYENVLTPKPQKYVISTNDIYNSIIECLNVIIYVKNALQEIIQNIKPLDIYNYISKNRTKLKFIIDPQERYIKERNYFIKFRQKG